MLPALLVYCCVVVLPALYTAFLSLFKWNGLGEKKFVLFRNYVNLFTTDAVFKTALKNNIIWIILTLLFTMTIALLLAMLLNRKFKGRVVYRAIFYFPYMLSWIVIGIIWKWIYNPNIGFLDSLLNLLGIQTSGAGWLSDPKIALYCVFAAALWQGVGQPMLYFLAGLQGIPQELYEAAAVDGAGKVATFFNVTIPQLKETFVIVLATLVIASLKGLRRCLCHDERRPRQLHADACVLYVRADVLVFQPWHGQCDCRRHDGHDDGHYHSVRAVHNKG